MYLRLMRAGIRLLISSVASVSFHALQRQAWQGPWSIVELIPKLRHIQIVSLGCFEREAELLKC